MPSSNDNNEEGRKSPAGGPKRPVEILPLICPELWRRRCALIAALEAHMAEFPELPGQEEHHRLIPDPWLNQRRLWAFGRVPGAITELPRLLRGMLQKLFAECVAHRLDGTHTTADGEVAAITQQQWGNLLRRADDVRVPVDDIADLERAEFFPQGRPTASRNPSVLRDVTLSAASRIVARSSGAAAGSGAATAVGFATGMAAAGPNTHPVKEEPEKPSDAPVNPNSGPAGRPSSTVRRAPRRVGRPSRKDEIVQAFQALTDAEVTSAGSLTGVAALIRNKIAGDKEGLGDEAVRIAIRVTYRDRVLAIKNSPGN